MKHFIPKKIYYLRALEITLISVFIFGGLVYYKFSGTSLLDDKNKFNLVSSKKYELKLAQALGGRSFVFQKTDKRADSVPVLVYHGVLDKIDDSDTTNISYKNFCEQMISLKKEGWQTVSLEDFISFTQGERILPEKAFLLTFDDGRKDSFYPVDPVLKELGFQAIIFVIGERMDSENETSFYLDKEEMEAMALSGRWSIQPHAFSGHGEIQIGGGGEKGHLYTNKMWLEDGKRMENDQEYEIRVRNDILAAKISAEEIVGKNKVISFAFPFGDYGQNGSNHDGAEEFLKKQTEENFQISFWQSKEFNYPERQILAKRIIVNESVDAFDLMETLALGGGKTIPFADSDFQEKSSWTKVWGDHSFFDGRMVVASSETTEGGSVFLNGARNWDNYAFRSKVDWLDGSNLVVYFRYLDQENNLSCNYSPDRVRIETRSKGEKKIIEEVKHGLAFPRVGLDLGVKVQGKSVECMLDGKIIAKTEVEEDALAKGSIGFGVWDKERGRGTLMIRRVDVSQGWEGETPDFEPGATVIASVR